MRSYQDPSLDYGFENETLSLMSFLTARAMMYLFKKDYVNLYNVIDVLYISTKAKIEKDLPKNFDDTLKDLNDKIYSGKGVDGYSRSKIFDETRLVWGEMATALTKADLMFRAKVDPGELVAQ